MENNVIDCSKVYCYAAQNDNHVFWESPHYSSEAINFGFAAILFAIALGIIVGSRIAWLVIVGRPTHEPIRKR